MSDMAVAGGHCCQWRLHKDASAAPMLRPTRSGAPPHGLGLVKYP